MIEITVSFIGIMAIILLGFFTSMAFMIRMIKILNRERMAVEEYLYEMEDTDETVI